MSFTDLLRNSRTSRVSVLHKFLTSYDPSTKRVYGFVEGEPDQSFYRLHIQQQAVDQKDVYIYNCEGKKGVYPLCADVLARYPDCKRVLFFVDKDLDDIIGEYRPTDPRVFTTDCYSIENYLVCRETIQRYFEDFVKIRRIEINVDAVLNDFDQHLSAFHRILLPVMAWIVVLRRRGSRPNLTDVRLDALFKVSDAGISKLSRRSRLAYLMRVAQVEPCGSVWRQVRATCRELQRKPPKTYVRGKFEAWWFVEFARRVSEGLQRVVTEAGGSVSISMQLNDATFVQLLTTGGKAPPGLDAFLRFHLGRNSSASAPPAPGTGRAGRGALNRLAALLKRLAT